VLPIKAIALNVLSIGAAFGIVVLIWQQGVGSDLIGGVPATGAIVNWVPLAIFAFLYGLSMDYEVFILSRVREEYDRCGDTTWSACWARRIGGCPPGRAAWSRSPGWSWSMVEPGTTDGARRVGPRRTTGAGGPCRQEGFGMVLGVPKPVLRGSPG
jgi:hypothetical protein